MTDGKINTVEKYCSICSYVKFTGEYDLFCQYSNLPVEEFSFCEHFQKREIIKSKKKDVRVKISIFAIISLIGSLLGLYWDEIEKDKNDEMYERLIQFSNKRIMFQEYFPSQDTLELKRIINIFSTEDKACTHERFEKEVFKHSYEALEYFTDEKEIFVDNILLKYNTDSSTIKLHHIKGVAIKESKGRQFKKLLGLVY